MSDDLAVDAPERDAEPTTSSSNDDSIGSFLRELPILLLIAFGLAFLLRLFVIQVFYIPSGSMVPTLEIDDRIVVEKISYQLRDPRRGEIIVFAGEEGSIQPDETGVQRIVEGVGQFLGVVPIDARDFVKRVIGLPGDVVSFDDGIVTVNGVELDEPYANLDGFGPMTYEIPEGRLFVLGDNRGQSSDSRYSLGCIDGDDVVGRAVLVIWPFDHAGTPARADYAEIPDDPPADAAADATGDGTCAAA